MSYVDGKTKCLDYGAVCPAKYAELKIYSQKN